ncbi:MAG: exodeoxyribonuclease VII large subunit [Porticoccaceae bacterium]|jgi:exodeoxyribonuclease VII large subunit
MIEQNAERQIFSISELNRRVRQLLEINIPMLWVEGEISNFACPASGHWYLSLKDKSAQVRCAMFRNANQRVKFKPRNGMQVLVRCKPGLYEDRGDYQLIIEHMEEAGFGALQRQFEQLKAKLSAEGLFDADNKRPIPTSISHIGVITSTTGAAVKDILSVLKRRFPAIKVSLFPTAVQGEEAPAQIVSALADANSHHGLDALIISRGGGSLEDLWAFNSEQVARAIAKSVLPIISAVGHEIDFTIADFVADLRAPTPSAAAEIISPDSQQIQTQLNRLQQSLTESLQRNLFGFKQQLNHLQKRLQHPGSRLQQQAQHLDHLDIRLRRAISTKLDGYRAKGNQLSDQLYRQNPQHQLEEKQLKLSVVVKQLVRAISQKQERLELKLAQSMHLLDTVSPLKTLGRGYAVIRDQQGEVISSVNAVATGDCLKGQLADGELLLEVSDKNNKTLG